MTNIQKSNPLKITQTLVKLKTSRNLKRTEILIAQESQNQGFEVYDG